MWLWFSTKVECSGWPVILSIGVHIFDVEQFQGAPSVVHKTDKSLVLISTGHHDPQQGIFSPAKLTKAMDMAAVPLTASLQNSYKCQKILNIWPIFSQLKPLQLGKNFVSDGHLCDRFCLAQPKIENLWFKTMLTSLDIYLD